MLEFNLRDSSLYYLNTSIYQNSLVSDKYSKYFKWVQDRADLPTYYTYTHLNQIGTETEKNLILLESSAIIPGYIKWVYDNSAIFNSIYTHNSILLNKCKNAKWIPGGGIWIGGNHGGGNIGVKKKTKHCSFISSNKIMCELHRFRYELFKYIEGKNYNVDFYGTASSGYVKTSDAISDYRYSIIMENYKDEMYFTEKILNCFAVGTIPIYLGATRISDKFNKNGILAFSSSSQLLNVIEGLDESYYNDNMSAVLDNYNRCLQYECIEDYMWENYIKEEYESRNSY